MFVDMQIDRHNADYAPENAGGIFFKSDIQVYASIADTIINNLSSVQSKIGAHLQSTSCSIAESDQPVRPDSELGRRMPLSRRDRTDAP